MLKKRSFFRFGHGLSLAVLILAASVSFGQSGSANTQSGGVQVNNNPANNGTTNGRSNFQFQVFANDPSGSASGSSNQDKMNSDGTGRDFNSIGAFTDLGAASALASGSSSTYLPGVQNGFTNYNNVSTTSAGSNNDSGSGTYDPWIITYRDLGTLTPGVQDFYYQTAIIAAGTSLTNAAGRTTSFQFDNYFKVGSVQTALLNLGAVYGSSFNRTATLGSGSGLSVFLLPQSAYDSTAPASTKLSGLNPATQTDINDAWVANSAWNLSDPVSPVQNLYFGFRLTGINIPAGTNLDDPAIALHMDSVISSVNPVPEPATMIALGVGLLGLKRRRKQS